MKKPEDVKRFVNASKSASLKVQEYMNVKREGIPISGHVVDVIIQPDWKEVPTVNPVTGMPGVEKVQNFAPTGITLQVYGVKNTIQEILKRAESNEAEKKKLRMFIKEEENGLIRLKAPVYETVDKNPFWHQNTEQFITDGDTIKVAGKNDVVKGLANPQIGSVVSLKDFCWVFAKNGKLYGAFSAATFTEVDVKANPSLILDYDFIPVGTSSFALHHNIFFTAKEDFNRIVETCRIDKMPYAVKVPARNVRFIMMENENEKPENPEEVVDEHQKNAQLEIEQATPGLYDLVICGESGTVNPEKAMFYLMKNTFKWYPKELDEDKRTKDKQLVKCQYKGRIILHGVTSHGPTKLVIQTSISEPRKTNWYDTKLGDCRQIVPITNRTFWEDGVRINFFDLFFYCEKSARIATEENVSMENEFEEVENTQPENDMKELDTFGSHTGSLTISAVSNNSFNGSVFGGWFGYQQATGLPISKDFAKSYALHIVSDLLSIQSKMIGKIYGLESYKILEWPLPNVDKTDKIPVDLSKTNPLNKLGTNNIVRFLPEFHQVRQDKTIVHPNELIDNNEVEVTCMVFRRASEELEKDTTNAILGELESNVGVFTVREVLSMNYGYLSKKNACERNLAEAAQKYADLKKAFEESEAYKKEKKESTKNDNPIRIIQKSEYDTLLAKLKAEKATIEEEFKTLYTSFYQRLVAMNEIMYLIFYIEYVQSVLKEFPIHKQLLSKSIANYFALVKSIIETKLKPNIDGEEYAKWTKWVASEAKPGTSSYFAKWYLLPWSMPISEMQAKNGPPVSELQTKTGVKRTIEHVETTGAPDSAPTDEPTSKKSSIDTPDMPE